MTNENGTERGNAQTALAGTSSYGMCPFRRFARHQDNSCTDLRIETVGKSIEERDDCTWYQRVAECFWTHIWLIPIEGEL